MPPSLTPPSLARRCVLLVEDDRMVRETIVLMLEDTFDVVLASTVASALVQLVDTPPQPIDVVLLDCYLPDGRFEEILAEADLRFIPVVLISGDGSLQEGLGPNRIFLPKPFSEAVLLSVLDSTRR